MPRATEAQASMDFETFAQQWTPLIERRLEGLLDEACAPPNCPEDLGRAIRYAVLGRGKRLRPLCTLVACRVCGGQEGAALDVGCAVELVHSYSLVHDDLPALDDDDIRRGRPSCHRAFGEALAILAGDALQAQAFLVLARALPPATVSRGVCLLAEAAGAAGMVGGQADDIRSWTGPLNLELVESSQGRKTAALFSAAFELGTLVAAASEVASRALSRFGRQVGLAFQIADDLLSFAQKENELGRPTSSDARLHRPIHPLVGGAEASRLRVEELLLSAEHELVHVGERTGLLRGFIDLVRQRVPQ